MSPYIFNATVRSIACVRNGVSRLGAFTGPIHSQLSSLMETIILRILKRGPHNRLKKSAGLKNMSSAPLFIGLWFLLSILVDFYILMTLSS